MKKIKKLKLVIMIIGLFFTLLYFSTQFGGMNLSINSETNGKKNITPLLSDGNSALFKWNRTWGGGDDDRGYGVAVDSSNNVYLVGCTNSFGVGNEDMVLVKYDGNGVQLWNQTWGGANSDKGYGITVDSSDNMYLTGSTYKIGARNDDMVLVKYDGNGMQQWNCTWGGGGYYDHGYGVAVDSSSNVYLAGCTNSFGAGNEDMALVKYDRNGVQLWNQTWGGGSDDHGYGVAVDSSDNVYLLGYTWSFGAGDYDIVLVKYDGNGVQQWNQTWGGYYDDVGYGVVVDSSGNVYLTGYTYSFGAGIRDMVLVKYNGNGVQLWNRIWGGGNSDYSYGVAVDSSDNVYLAGSTYSFGAGSADMVLIKYDGNGKQKWNCIWGGGNSDYGYGVTVDSSDNVYLTGSTYSFGAGSFDMVLVKYGNAERLPSDEVIMIVIIIVSIASIAGVSIAIIYFIRKRWKIVK